MPPDFTPVNPLPRDAVAPRDGGGDVPGLEQSTSARDAEILQELIDLSRSSSSEETGRGDEEDSEERSDLDEPLPQPYAIRQAPKEHPTTLQTSRTTKKRKRKGDRSSSASEEGMPVYPIPESAEPDNNDPAAHISCLELPPSLIDGKFTGPGKGWLGLPIGLFTNDPFEFDEDDTIEDRLSFYRVVFANFTTSVVVRWNISMINVYGNTPRRLSGKRIPAASCTVDHVSFFREHAVFKKLKGKEATVYLYSWMRSYWNMGTAFNLPNLRSCVQEDFRTQERESRKRRMESNDYLVPLFRDRDFGRKKDPREGRSRVVQQMVSALNSLQFLPFHHYDLIEGPADEHLLQELFWNFSFYVDILCTVRDQIQADHGNTLISTRKARTLHRNLTGEAMEALGRLLSEPLRTMGTPPKLLERAGGATLFGRYPADHPDSAIPLEIPAAGTKVGTRRPVGFDDYEALVFQKLGEFSVRGKERFGCNEVMSDSPSFPQDQQSWERATPEQEALRIRAKDRRNHQTERKRILQEMEQDPEMHPSRTSYWLAPTWDKRKAPPTPPRWDFPESRVDPALKELLTQINRDIEEEAAKNWGDKDKPREEGGSSVESRRRPKKVHRVGRDKNRIRMKVISKTGDKIKDKAKVKAGDEAQRDKSRCRPNSTGGANLDNPPEEATTTSPVQLVVEPPTGTPSEETGSPSEVQGETEPTGEPPSSNTGPERVVNPFDDHRPDAAPKAKGREIVIPVEPSPITGQPTATSIEPTATPRKPMATPNRPADNTTKIATKPTKEREPVTPTKPAGAPTKRTIESSKGQEHITPEKDVGLMPKEDHITPRGKTIAPPLDRPGSSRDSASASPRGKMPKAIKRSKLLTRSPEQELKRARARAFRLDYYDLHYKLRLANGSTAHHMEEAERQALTEEAQRREETMEGFGVMRSEPTPLDQREQEAIQMAAQMSTRWLRIHQEYIKEGSGAYNAHQERAIRDELANRPDADDMASGTDSDEGSCS